MSTPEIVNCIYDVNKKCGYPEKLDVSDTPKVFVICSTEFRNVVEWIKTVFDNNIRTEEGSKFDVIYFTDTSTWDFCNNVCIPIHEAWFCIAVLKEELLPVYSRRQSKEFITSYISRLNPNVFFEVGLALALKKGVIFYKGKNQDMPSDWTNLAKLVISEPSNFLSPEDTSNLTTQLKRIIELNPFIPKSIKWEVDETD